MYEVQINRRSGGADESFEAETVEEAFAVAHDYAEDGDWIRIIDLLTDREAEVFEMTKAKRLTPRPAESDWPVTEGPMGVAGFRSGRYR